MTLALVGVCTEVALWPTWVASAAPPTGPVETPLDGIGIIEDPTDPPPVPADPAGPILFGDFDANGDGERDIITVTPPAEAGEVARVSIISVSPDLVLHDILMEQPNDLVLYAGGIGDVNNDGRSDFAYVVARWLDDVGGPDSFVDVRSGATGALLYRLRGSTNDDGFGIAIAAVGDTNGDGFDDVLVGSSGQGLGINGRAYLFSGRDGVLIRTHNGLPSATMFGSSVAGIGDIDGDGCADYAVGAPDTDGITAGSVHVFSGANGELVRQLAAIDGGGAYGRHVAAIEDINGDQVAEIVISEPLLVHDVNGSGEPVRRGLVRIYSGASGSQLIALEGANGYTFGTTINSTANDEDSDGRGDLLIGSSSLATPSALESVIVSTYSGADLRLVGVVSMSELMAPAIGVAPPSADFNQDGIVDVVDLNILLYELGVYTNNRKRYDLNRDGAVNTGDIVNMLNRLGETEPLPAYGAQTCQQIAGYTGIAYAFLVVGCGIGSIYFTPVFFFACFGYLTGPYGVFTASSIIAGGCAACSIQSVFHNDPNLCP